MSLLEARRAFAFGQSFAAVLPVALTTVRKKVLLGNRGLAYLTMQQSDQYAFVLNLFQCSNVLPLVIGTEFELNHSTPGQARRISEFLASYGSAPWVWSGPRLYEYEPVEPAPNTSHLWKPIPPDQRKFWVLNFSGDPSRVWSYSTVTQLTDAELEIGAVFGPPPQNSITQLDPARVFHFWEQHREPVLQPLEADDLQAAWTLQTKLSTLSASGRKAEQTVCNVYSDFAALSRGPRSGDLVLLGHFALIEALITHNPHQFGDSLTHQVSTKMCLLMRRFAAPLDCAAYFKTKDATKVWKELYGIRSSIAHGKRVDQRPNALGNLRDIETVSRFVRHALKRLLVHAVDEPQFIFDLKAC